MQTIDVDLPAHVQFKLLAAYIDSNLSEPSRVTFHEHVAAGDGYAQSIYSALLNESVITAVMHHLTNNNNNMEMDI